MHTHDREHCWQRRSSLPSSLIPHQYTGPRTALEREYVLPPIYGHGFPSDLHHQHETPRDRFPANTPNRGPTQADTPSTLPYLHCDSVPYYSNLSTTRPTSTQSPNSYCFPLWQKGKAGLSSYFHPVSHNKLEYSCSGHPLNHPPLTEAYRKGNSYKTLDAVSDPPIDSNRGEGPQSRGKSRPVIVGGNAKNLRSRKKTFIACNFCRSKSFTMNQIVPNIPMPGISPETSV
jgi:hypothetical protein